MAKMKFIASAENQEHLIVVDDHDKGDGVYTVELNGKKYKVDARPMPSEIVTAVINNKSYDIDIDEKDRSSDPLDGQMSVRVRGRVVGLEILEERRKKMKDAQSSQFSHAGAIQITSPMPGKVLRYLVDVGDEVEEGQGLVVIEAMKMENELRAPRAARVTKIASEEGASVDGGTLLIAME